MSFFGDVVALVGGTGLLLFFVVLVLLAILLPLSAYAAQKWAYKTYKEAQRISATLDEIADMLDANKRA
ncbi:MAG TPA: hypothetical protein DIT63_08390 [Gammaproteobacteria bacterium]|nr:hypothetical protein [Gammaproteobacteria bacterium]